MIYTGPETNVGFDSNGDTLQEDIQFEWNYVDADTRPDAGRGRRTKAVATNTTVNPSYIGYNHVNGTDVTNAKAPQNANITVQDNIYVKNTDNLLPTSDNRYYNKNVITVEERNDLEVLEDYTAKTRTGTTLAKRVKNAEDLARRGYYIPVYMPDNTLTYLPRNSFMNVESDYTAEKDVGVAISN